jgi:hypothetical protein
MSVRIVIGTLLVLLSVPCVLPVPGVGNVLGLGLLLMALAMWRGQASHELPSRVASWQMPAHWAQRVLGLLARFYSLAGRWSRERWLHLVDGPQGWLAPKVALMGGLIFLPIPFGNVLPALALSLLGLGLVFRDGLAVLAAMLAGGGKDLRAMGTEERLVGRDDRLAEAERRQRDLAGNRGAADEFADKVNIRVGGDRERVGRQPVGRNAHRTLFAQIAHGGAVQTQLDAEARLERRPGALDVFPHALPDGAEAADADVDDGKFGHGWKKTAYG